MREHMQPEDLKLEPEVMEKLQRDRDKICEVIYMIVDDIRRPFYDNKRQVRAIKALADLLH